MDLNGDGTTDLISASSCGGIYVFRRNPEETGFSAGKLLRNADGSLVDVEEMSTAHAADWDNDGDVDLLIGTRNGEIYLSLNDGKRPTL